MSFQRRWRRTASLVLGGALIFIAGIACSPQVVEVEKEVTVEVPVEVPVEVEVIKEVEVEVEVEKEVTVEIEVEVTKEVEVTRLVEVEGAPAIAAEPMVGSVVSNSPVFFPYAAENPSGTSHLIRSPDGLSAGFTTGDLTPGDAMTLWYIFFNYPEKCIDGPFQCGPQDLGSNREAMGDFLYVPGAGGVVGPDGTMAFHGSIGLNDPTGTGLVELPDGCVPGYEDCGEPVGLLNPGGALVIVALHSHGPALSGADLANQTSSYLGGCETVIGTLPGGFSASPEEIPSALGECSTVQISPHAPDAAVAISSPAISSGPAFLPYDAENPLGNSYLVRAENGLHGGFSSSSLTVGDAMTLWFIFFNYPEKCIDGPFMCGPQDLGSNREAMGDFLYIPGAGAVIGEDGRVTFSGSIGLNDPTGTGLVELPDGCVPGYEGCGEPVGLLNPSGALVITALHSHGPALTGDDLANQLSSYLGGCETVIGTLPGGFSASPEEIPDAPGECSTIHISPHAP